MGRLLYLSHSTENLTRCDNIWREVLFDIPLLPDWSKLGEYRQKQMDKNTVKENSSHVDWDYQPGDKLLVINDGIFHKSENQYDSEPWTITSVHTMAE